MSVVEQVQVGLGLIFILLCDIFATIFVLHILIFLLNLDLFVLF